MQSTNATPTVDTCFALALATPPAMSMNKTAGAEVNAAKTSETATGGLRGGSWNVCHFSSSGCGSLPLALPRRRVVQTNDIAKIFHERSGHESVAENDAQGVAPALAGEGVPLCRQGDGHLEMEHALLSLLACVRHEEKVRARLLVVKAYEGLCKRNWIR
eukprot:scaffold1583_cov299-Pinguiococcus_pyrenoidosus.AAC.9